MTAIAQETFQGSEIARPKVETRKLPPNARLILLKAGEIREVLNVRTPLFRSKEEKAFYVPAEGNAVLHVTVETKFGSKTYFVKALAVGETVGGVVARNALDEKGYSPKSEAEHARIQKAIKEAPIIFVV